MRSTTEIELKYAVQDGGALPPLGGLAGVVAAEAVPPASLDAVYFDTADRTLLRARIALRRRTGGHDAGWHLKLPAAAGRTELQAAIDPEHPDAVPAGFEAALRTRVRGRALEPIARIRTVRSAVVVTGPGGGAVEVVDDAVTATDVAAGVLRAWREWEAEQVGDDPAASAALLATVDTALHEAGATRAASPAKLAQALGLVGAPAAAAPTTAGAALVAMLAPLAEQLHRDAATLHDGDDEDLHRLRKTLRRITALLALQPVAGPSGAALREAVRGLGAPLGAVRDPVVAAGLAGGLLDEVDPDAPGAVAARARLVTGPLAAAGPARVAAAEALHAPEALEVFAALDALLADGPDGPEADAPVGALRDMAKATIRRAVVRARRAGTDLESLHDARKAVRRVRFVIASLVEAGVVRPRSRTARLAAAAERAQDALGAHRDLAVLVDALPQVSAAATAAGENAFVLGLLAGSGARRVERLRRRGMRRLRAFERAAR